MSDTGQTPLQARIDADLRQAMRDQDNVTKLALRAVKTALTEAAKAGANHELTDAQVISVIQREAKRRREAASEYERLGAGAQAAQERAELAVLERYLPRQMDEAEIEQLARQVIAETGATSARDLGKVMPVLMGRVAGAADGKVVSQVVRRLLES
ncbi:MAG TPA: GatB/YqeY domain-containing protein [Caldilineaceae bacterium]|nr:GatB/YqeY domain-containing protein [Caldilineaceae bacterium]